MTDLDKAREWASEMASYRGPCIRGTEEAADLILSLPDHWVDTEKVREVTDRHNDLIVDFLDQFVCDMHPDTWEAIRDFMCELNVEVDALAIPKLPTLADMTREEQEACVSMQADYSPLGEPVERVAIMGITEFGAILMSQNWERSHREASRVTPLPDLPKLQWPGSAPDDVAYATGGVLTTQDVVDECRAVRKERAVPCPEGVPDPHPGEAWLVNTREGEQREALKAGNRWYVKDGDDVEEWVEEALTPISRLVPESHTLPKGMRLADNEEFGRVVTSPWADDDNDYRIFFLNEDARGGANYDFAHESTLTFLDGGQHV